MKVQAKTPGKLILSGEHAVVYGKPAIAVAVTRQATATVTSTNTSDTVLFTLPRYGVSETVSFAQLRKQTQALWSRHELAQEGQLNTAEVITHPIQPLQAAVIHAMDALNAPPSEGFALHLDSDIPSGCGLGSSAATILSALRATTSYGEKKRVQKEKKIDQDWYERAAGRIEELHHGRPSGVDVATCARGGFLRFYNGQITPLPPPDFPLHLVHTGTPTTNTATCMFHVKQHRDNHNLWNGFEQVTHKLEHALLQQDISACRQAIRCNHRLLTAIGVVPLCVQGFIAEIERQGGAAKICGAGAVSGDGAGMVWVVSDPFPSQICQQYGYKAMMLRAITQGAQIR